jgi:hypothetical protein
MRIDELHIAFPDLAKDIHAAFEAEERLRDQMESLANLWVALAAPVDAMAAIGSSLRDIIPRFIPEADEALDRLRVLVWDAMIAAAASTNALVCESEDDMLDEAARARFPEMLTHTRLAELRLGLSEDDERQDEAERKSVRRRLARLDERIQPLMNPCRQELFACIDAELAVVDPGSNVAAELKSIKHRVLDPADPCVRLAAKRWFNFLTMVAAVIHGSPQART